MKMQRREKLEPKKKSEMGIVHYISFDSN
jgi:hypothetical protein